MKRATACLVLAALAACSADEAPPVANPAFDVDATRISVSGISSGAYMAGQLHVAHSATFGGAALLAGGPYYCARGSVREALGACVKGGAIAVDEFARYAEDAAQAGRIDGLQHLADDRVWLFHGANDDVVSVDATRAAAAFYARYIDEDHISVVTDVPVIHSFPTLQAGNACGEFASPFLVACDYDAAGALLQALHGELEPRTSADGELRLVAQPGAADAEMLESAYLYVPSSCAAGGSCGLHVAFHGCQQSTAYVGDAFVTGAGYNEWAESNRMLVLYPQVASSKALPLNPLGCWDWWGYTGDGYAARDGAQIAVIMATIESISGKGT